MELIVQKAVELGVYKIVPVAMKRSVVRLDDKKAAKKVSLQEEQNITFWSISRDVRI